MNTIQPMLSSISTITLTQTKIKAYVSKCIHTVFYIQTCMEWCSLVEVMYGVCGCFFESCDLVCVVSRRRVIRR